MSSPESKRPMGGRIIEGEIDTDGDAGGSTDASGQIDYVDFTGLNQPSRDDVMPVDQKKRLIDLHAVINKAAVIKQKEKMTYYKEIKNGKKPQRDSSLDHGAGYGYGKGIGASNRKPHPILSAKLNGADLNVTPVPNDYEGNTNDAYRNRLENRPQSRPAPDITPQSTPKLTR